MMNKTTFFKLGCLMTITLIFTAMITGCWDRQEAENRAYVLGTGFDYLEERGLYEITVQIANPAALAGGDQMGGGGGEGQNVSVTSAMGQTPYHAAQNLQLHTSRGPFFGHNKLLVVSESLARRGMGPVLDYFDRERETRSIAFPLILPDDYDMTELFRTEVPLETYSTEGMERQVRVTVFDRSVFPTRSLVETFSVLALPGRQPLIGRINLGELEEEDQLGEEEAVRSTIHLEGGAVFNDDQMQGWFEQAETVGWFIIHGRMQTGIFVVNCPIHDQHPISLEVFEVTPQLTPVVTENGEVRIELDIQVDGRIQDQTCPQTYEREGELIDSLESRFSEAIRREIEASIHKAQELKTDVFGFGNLFYRKKPDVWQEIQEDWEEDVFVDIPVDIDIDLEIRRAGLVTDPLITD